MLNAILSRWAGSRAAAAVLDDDTATTLCTGAYPARKSAVNDSLWQTLRRLIPVETGTAAAPLPSINTPSNRLPAACADFEACLSGLDEASAARLRQQIRRSRSLSELWHLRGGLFTALARAHSQSEAQQRLAQLSTHFTDLRH